MEPQRWFMGQDSESPLGSLELRWTDYFAAGYVNSTGQYQYLASPFSRKLSIELGRKWRIESHGDGSLARYARLLPPI